MIIKSESLSMAESLEFVKGKEDGTELVGFIKKFVKLKPSEAREMREQIKEIESPKIKSENISKVIDILPENKEDLTKIFTEVGLDEDESNKVLDIVKKNK